jgi:hypothetical protein
LRRRRAPRDPTGSGFGPLAPTGAFFKLSTPLPAERIGGGAWWPRVIRAILPHGCADTGLDIAINAKRQVADAAARAEAKAVIERWNEQIVASRDILWSPTIRAALIAGTPWLDVFCAGCGTSRAIDLRNVDRPSRRLPPSCSASAAHGARNRRRCRGSSDCTRCSPQQRLRRRPVSQDATARL